MGIKREVLLDYMDKYHVSAEWQFDEIFAMSQAIYNLGVQDAACQKEIDHLKAQLAMQADAVRPFEHSASVIFASGGYHGMKELADKLRAVFNATAEDVAKYKAEITAPLQAIITELEANRPHWAKGYTSDGVAAQCSSSALSALWKLLGVDNQTQAIETLRKLVASKAEIEKKVLEYVVHNIETMNAQRRISIQDVVDAVNQMSKEREV